MVLNPITGKAEAYDIESNNISDLQSFFRNKAINPFEGISFGSRGYFMFSLTKKWELIEGSSYQTQGRTYRSRIQKFDSLSRICPDFQIPVSKGNPVEISFPFTISSLKLSTSPITLTLIDALITVESVDRIKTICEGEAPKTSVAPTNSDMIVKIRYLNSASLLTQL